jgi:hypothetical protein
VAAAALVARSQARSGWPTFFEGRDQTLEDLTVPGSVGAVPTRAALAPEAASALSGAGFVPLAATPGRDHVFMPAAPTAHRDASLARQLGTARLSKLFRAALRDASPSGDASALEAAARKQLMALGLPPGDFDFKLVTAAGHPEGVRAVTLRFRAGPPVFPAARDVDLSFLI